MKHKLVIRVSMDDHKSRKKAFQTVVACSGVESTAVGKDNDQLEVIGEGIDPTKITEKLRKKVGHSELISFGPVGEKKEEKKEAKPAEPGSIPPVIFNAYPYTYSAMAPYQHIYEVRDPNPDPCSIM